MHNRNLASPCTLCLCLLGLVVVGVQAQAAKNTKDQPAKTAKSASSKRGSQAHRKPDAPIGAQAKAAIADSTRLLQSSQRQEIEAGIQGLGLIGAREAVAPLAARIRQGLPPELLEAAIVTLMALGQPDAGPVLYELSAHRRPQIRLRAIEAITATHPPGAEQALVTALSDSDSTVRSAAAAGLGEVGSKAVLEKLFLALDRGNLEASSAIGKVIEAADVRRLVSYLGQLPFHHLGPALTQVLARTDVSERTKLEIVGRLEEVGTAEIKGYLGELISTSGQALPPNVSRAVLRAMQEIAN
jgi:HEAT repeat protein